MKSNVEKFLGPERIVILDSMNYIKGYRYELYCLARNAMTTLCLVYCDTDFQTAAERCEALNQQPKSEGQGEEESKDQI